MRQYEITFIVDPVLSNDEISSAAQNYVELLQSDGCEIVHVDDIGLKALAYPIKKRTSGVYYCVEFKAQTGEIISKIELAMQRDERIIRFLSVALDKYGIKFNEDRRNGLIGKKRDKKESADSKDSASSSKKVEKAAAPKKPEPAPVKEAVVAAAPAVAEAVVGKSEEE